jgi:hypothetical protein
VDGSNAQKIIQLEDDRWNHSYPMTFSRDGSELIYELKEKIYSVRIDGSGNRFLFAGRRPFYH